MGGREPIEVGDVLVCQRRLVQPCCIDPLGGTVTQQAAGLFSDPLAVGVRLEPRRNLLFRDSHCSGPTVRLQAGQFADVLGSSRSQDESVASHCEMISW